MFSIDHQITFCLLGFEVTTPTWGKHKQNKLSGESDGMYEKYTRICAELAGGIRAPPVAILGDEGRGRTRWTGRDGGRTSALPARPRIVVALAVALPTPNFEAGVELAGRCSGIMGLMQPTAYDK